MEKLNYRLRKGRKVMVERDNGIQEEFFYGGKINGEISLLKRTKHSLGNVLELRLDSSYQFSRNSVKVSDDVSYYIYGRWHHDYESKNKLLEKR